MLVYLLKSTACMAVFLLFYKLLLEKENMHQFKRFYLLGVLVASLVIPSLVLVEYVEPTLVDTVASSITLDGMASEQQLFTKNINTINLPFLLWSIYFIGLIGFSFRFFKNLIQIIRRIVNNPKFKGNSIINVLLKENIVPHTFFNFIFLNKSKYESNTIPKEVLLHEETHAKQRHSFDVLFVELIQLLLWFNPLIYFINKSIKLNHEFLADRAVIENGVASSSYQQTLLSYMTPNHHQSLASAINYSSIKKRFTIMKTHTSKKAIFLRSLLLLPLLSLLIYGFSETNVVQVQAELTEKEISTETISLKTKKLTSENATNKQKGASRKLMAEYNKLAKHYNAMSSSNMRIKKKDVNRLTYIYGLMSDKQKADAQPFPNFPPMPEPPLPPKPLKEPKPAKVLKAPKPVKAVKGVKSDIPPPPAPRVLKGEISDIPPPPAPPKPISPLDHVVKMAKKGAQFFYNGKEISSDKAIALLKKNDQINIDSRSKGKRPIVKLTDDPITIKK